MEEKRKEEKKKKNETICRQWIRESVCSKMDCTWIASIQSTKDIYLLYRFKKRQLHRIYSLKTNLTLKYNLDEILKRPMQL